MLIFFGLILINLSLAVLPHPLNLLLIKLILNAFITLRIVVHVQDKRKGNPIIDLNPLHGVPIKSEASKVNDEDWRARLQFETLLGIDFFLALVALILVVTLKLLGLDVILKSHL